MVIGKRGSFHGDYTAKVVTQIQTQHSCYAMHYAVVTTSLDDQEKNNILHNSKSLNHSVFHRYDKQTGIVQPKRIDQVLLNQNKVN
jgi:hypothetical protein